MTGTNIKTSWVRQHSNSALCKSYPTVSSNSKPITRPATKAPDLLIIHHYPILTVFRFVVVYDVARDALRLLQAREIQRPRSPLPTTKTTQNTTMTPASWPAQFRLAIKWLTASRASIGVRAAILDCRKMGLAFECSVQYQTNWRGVGYSS